MGSKCGTGEEKNGQHRFCVDFRGLNSATEKDVYPLPTIHDILDTLAGMKYFTTLDQANAYWSIPIKKSDMHKYAFITPIGLYEFKYLPFGMCNAPASFMRLMNILLCGLQWNMCMVYLDDILIFVKDFPTMLERINLVFQRLEK